MSQNLQSHLICWANLFTLVSPWNVDPFKDRPIELLTSFLSPPILFLEVFCIFFFFSSKASSKSTDWLFFPPPWPCVVKAPKKIWGYCFVLGDVPPVWLFYLRIRPLVLWSQRVSECCVLQLAEGGLAQTSPLRINSLFAATDTNLQSAEFVCLVKRKKGKIKGSLEKHVVCLRCAGWAFARRLLFIKRG